MMLKAMLRCRRGNLMPNPWIVNGRQLTIDDVVSKTATTTDYPRKLGVIVDICDVCDKPIESDACKLHCKK